jgi:hypothetical protein
MNLLLIALPLLLGGLVLFYVPVAYASVSPWQLFQHLCAYISPGSPQCLHQPQPGITPLPQQSIQQQPTATPYCTTNPNDPACQQQLQPQQQQPQQQPQQQNGPPADGP